MNLSYCVLPHECNPLRCYDQLRYSLIHYVSWDFDFNKIIMIVSTTGMHVSTKNVWNVIDASLYRFDNDTIWLKHLEDINLTLSISLLSN